MRTDLTDFEEELEEIDGPIFDRGNQTVVQIHLSLEQAEAVRRIAKAKGMDEAELVREWVGNCGLPEGLDA